MSWNTWTCPSQPLPAPMPMVGMASRFVISVARDAGTHSSTSEKTPASSSALASSIMRTADLSDLPWTR